MVAEKAKTLQGLYPCSVFVQFYQLSRAESLLNSWPLAFSN